MHRPKHYEYHSDSGIAAGSTQTVFNYSLTESLNLHGLRGDICFATPTAPAYIVANWALMCVPEIISTLPGISDTEFNADSIQAFVWASGKILVDDNGVQHIPINLATSRNCEQGMQLVFLARLEEVLSGTSPTLNVSVGLTWWETQT